jgi:hypothetical protein
MCWMTGREDTRNAALQKLGITTSQRRCTAAASLIWQSGPATDSATNGGVKPDWHPKKLPGFPHFPYWL